MRQKYELLNFTPNTPLHCSLQKIGEITPHIHDFFEVVMILSGSCKIHVADEVFHLKADDIIAFNCHTTHSLQGRDCVLISVQFDQTLFENTLPAPFRPSFSCNSVQQGNLPAFDALRRQIARLVKNNTDQRPGYELRNWSLVYDLMDIFYNHFRLDNASAQSKKLHRYADRMARINHIISKNYQENFTLSALAEEVHLSVPYLSKFFEQHYGMNFLSYLTEIRLNHAITDLLNTEKTIDQVSADSGFPNSHAFVQAFKKQYGQLPSIYRRQQKSSKPETLDYLPEQSDYIAGLKKYLELPGNEKQPEQISTCLAKISGKEKGKPLRHTWRAVMPGGSARDLLFGEIQDMVHRLQQEVGFRYIHFHGILSDEMRLCSRDRKGQLSFSFLYVDKLLDFILREELKPVVELGFMPEVLAKDPGKKFLNYCTSEPALLTDWAALVAAFTEHCIQRYGIQEVRQWLFTPWSQPDTPSHMFAFSSDQAFYEFYRATWQAVKGVNSAIAVGTPATYYIVQQEHWYLSFLDWCKANGCAPDFLNFHYYDTVQRGLSEDAQDLFGFTYAMTLGESPDGISDFVRQVRQENREGLPIYLTEWNNTPSQQDWLNDTCFKSCYIVKGILDNMDALESFGYWSLTDWMGEAAVQPELFSGGVGLYTRNGIPKPVFYALTLLKQLGDTYIGSGEGWYATRQGETIQILLYNYRHFSHLYALGERFDMTFTDRYTPFTPEKYLDTHIVLSDLTAEEYVVREVTVSRKHGSAFDQWVNMGALELEEPELENLAAKSRPGISKYLSQTKNGTLELDALLEMLEVRLITLKPR